MRNKQTNVMYKIDCKDCEWSYIGETGRSFETRKKELMRNVRLNKKESNITNHAWRFDHRINFDNRQINDKGNYRLRNTVKSWYTAKTTHVDNNSKPLPEQYTILLKK